jgi:hypothetical protein
MAFLCITTLANAQWAQLGINIDGEAAGDRSYIVATSSDGATVAIGAPFNDGNGNGSGHVRVYKYIDDAWVQLGADINGEAADDQSGYSVSISSDGSTVAIGAPSNDGNGSGSGHVRVYQYNGFAWVQLGTDIDGEAAGDQSGYSVSMSSDGATVAIGARFNDGNGLNAGNVRVYSYNGFGWVQRGTDIDGEAADDNSGYTVSISSDGSTVAIGSPFNDGNGNGSGHVRVYQYDGFVSSWMQRGADIDGEAAGDQSGYSLSMSSDGATVAIGAPFNAGNVNGSGHVRVYQYDGFYSTWVKLSDDIDGEAADDYSGYSVSMSSDGATLAIGGPFNAGNGNGSGHLRVYKYNIIANIWMQLGADIDGEAADDQSGYSASMSSDGATVAIGAPSNDGRGQNAGHVRVYQFETLCTPPIIAGSATVCSGTNSTTLNLSGYTGSVIKWQSSTSNTFDSELIDIANTTITLTATNLTTTTYYRAVITGGACVAANSGIGTLRSMHCQLIQ